jgi:hypothetical protein
MKLVTCQQAGQLKAITFRPPLLVDLLAEEGAPFSAMFNLFDDPTATNLRGLWQPWSEYEQGEVTYVTPEGAESGDASEHTPNSFGVWTALRRTQHSGPGKPGSLPFWAPMRGMDLAGVTASFVVPGEEIAGTVSGEYVEVAQTAVQTFSAPSSLPYRLELREAGSTVLIIARGQVIYRKTGEPEEPFVAEAGESFEATIRLYEGDPALRVPKDLTGWTVELSIEGGPTLVGGKGLTVTPEAGEVLVQMTGAETTSLAPKLTRCTLTIQKEGREQRPLHRAFVFQT